jgi:hypothetical protein
MTHCILDESASGGSIGTLLCFEDSSGLLEEIFHVTMQELGEAIAEFLNKQGSSHTAFYVDTGT